MMWPYDVLASEWMACRGEFESIFHFSTNMPKLWLVLGFSKGTMRQQLRGVTESVGSGSQDRLWRYGR